MTRIRITGAAIRPTLKVALAIAVMWAALAACVAHAAPRTTCRLTGCTAEELAALTAAGDCPNVTVPTPVCPQPVVSCPQAVVNCPEAPACPPAPACNCGDSASGAATDGAGTRIVDPTTVVVTAKVQDCAVCRTHPSGVTICRRCKVTVGGD